MFSVKELAAMYGCHPETMTLVLIKIGVRQKTAGGRGNRTRLTPMQVEIVKIKIGPPRFDLKPKSKND